MKVLIIDDDELALELLRSTLELNGYEVVTATNGRDGLQLLQGEELRLVVSDWEMPEMTGVELCRAIRGGAVARYVYFVLVTSHDQVEHRVNGLAAGADDFMSKPFDPSELIVRIRAGERILGLESRDLVIFSMAKLAESRDTDTGAHLERVRQYSRLLAKQLATTNEFSSVIDSRYAHQIYLTSPLHDIGKIAIPDAILLKPGQLNDREFEIMKTHTILGAQTLDAALLQYPSAEFLSMARDIAESHHERFDGSGYPHGRSGEDIPLCGRIVAVADTYDALTSRRVYKPAYSHTTARGIIESQSGKQFDPRVVSAFLAQEESFIATCEENQDETSVDVQSLLSPV